MKICIAEQKEKIRLALTGLDVVVDVVNVEGAFEQQGKIIEFCPWKFVELRRGVDSPHLPFAGASAGIHRIWSLSNGELLYVNDGVPAFYKDAEAVEENRRYVEALDRAELPQTPSPRMLELREQGVFCLPDEQ
jgi:hypothetical protein